MDAERRQVIVLSDCTARPLAELLHEAGVVLRRSCGGKGLCYSCSVLVREGAVLADGVLYQAPARVRSCRAVARSEALVLELLGTPEGVSRVEDAFTLVRALPPPGRGPFAGKNLCALAIDIGTTTVAARLFDAWTGEYLSGAGALNPQTRLGDDVLSRIEAAAKPGGLAQLQSLVLQSLEDLTHRCLRRADRLPENLAGVVVAGNTVMGHLFWGEDPSGMGAYPFTPCFVAPRQCDGGDLLPLWAGVPVRALPHRSAFIGSDISAGLWACDFFNAPGTALFMDVGTNGEIVLKTPRGLFAASAAAGPAFEGYGLLSGMRARAGAIDAVAIAEGRAHVHAIEEAAPLGICGSGYVDFLAQALRAGWLLPRGRFSEKAPVCESPRGGRAVRLSDGPNPVWVSEADIAALLKAKSAIAATLLSLLARAKTPLSSIDSVFIAGGFGRHLSTAHAQAIGLLPPLPAERIRYVGNTALGGAMLCGLDAEAVPLLEKSLAAIEVVEVNLEPTFADHFIDEMRLGEMGAET